MKKIGLLSDTHSYWDKKFEIYFKDCDEIWHAGDIGSEYVLDKLSEICPVKAVYGNCDSKEIRLRCSNILRWKCEDADILMTHIGGYPGKYAPQIKSLLIKDTPNLFISGHSHILKVQNDPGLKMLHINPGAAGIFGWHKIRTIIRLDIDGNKFQNLEVIEMTK